ncbi:hypothetical protein PGT21_025551 [Puccinia graminis f. sp. tritici]|uniref:Uncharacterized protein n=1 Tax=Puccinia graminis f. sp. tritici TaxID=56615 RepID=A0A5B0N9A8_PUCGR|nr:hypothetical protein PGT21_025551 [Puccinia graminis f. sp. tritici]KAA1092252.1 hypothetical protein PGTUg99_006802 [Puccinia graminis f. sp. tritici]
MATIASNGALHSILGGLQPGGTCLSWMAGLVACEALRLTQRFTKSTSWCTRFFVYFALAMSVTLAGLFASVLYHYCVESYGNYEALRHITRVLRFHFVCSRVATFAGFLFYTQSVWGSKTGKLKICKIPIVQLILVVVNMCLYALFTLRIIRLFSLATFEDFADTWLFERSGQSVQLACGVVLTFIKAYDLSRSDDISKVLAMKNDPFRCAWGVLCLLCQTAIFPTVFDTISVCQNQKHGISGASYSILSVSAELHLFGPIMAISAALDDDDTIVCGTPCPVGRSDRDDGDAGKRHITFQSLEKRERHDT